MFSLPDPLFLPNLMYVDVNAVTTRAFGLCADSDNQRGADRKRTMRRTRPLSSDGGPASLGAVAASSVRNTTHDAVTPRRARMALQQRPRLPDRDSEAIHGWPCMLAQGPQRSIGHIVGWHQEIDFRHYVSTYSLTC